MMTAKEVRAWLDTLPDDALVGIDETGLALQEVGTCAYIEVGGLPLGHPEEDDGYPPRCTHPGGHKWNRSAWAADEARLSGDYANDNIRCIYCGADGDA